jgi:peptidoglycan hydrolase-like protein with peptidoglycan-binding domain
VAGIQRNLATLGLYKGRVDGIDGPRTKAAVKAFQKAQGLVADGKYGKMTDEAMDRALAARRRAQGSTAVKTGTGVVGSGATAELIAGQAEKLERVAQWSDVIQYGVIALVVVGVLITLYGIIQGRTTTEELEDGV